MKKIIDSPFTNGKATLQRQKEVREFRKEKFEVIAHFYICEDTKEEFGTTETDELTIQNLYNQYRAKHKIPFPDEISLIREQYGFSAAKISELLGLGINTFGSYEKGEMPTLANSTLLKIAKNPMDFHKNILHNGIYLDEKTEKAIERLKASNSQIGVNTFFEKADKMTGFRTTNWQRIFQFLTVVLEKSIPEYNTRLKLNKQFFYFDFACFRQLGRSATGLSYQAIQYGPVPYRYDQIFSVAENEGIIKIENQVLSNGHMIEGYKAIKNTNLNVFSKQEQEIAHEIIAKFGQMKTNQIVNISHTESAWIENEKTQSLIDYNFAFDLKNI